MVILIFINIKKILITKILDNINTIIMENDYKDILHKEYIDKVLKSSKFTCVYTEAGGWGCCYNNFFEVWKRNNT